MHRRLQGRGPGAARGEVRARTHCRFVLPLIHFIPKSLTYSVPLFEATMRPDRTPGEVPGLAVGAERRGQVLRELHDRRAGLPHKRIRYHAFGLIRTALSKKIGVFQSSSLKVVPISRIAPCVREADAGIHRQTEQGHQGC